MDFRKAILILTIFAGLFLFSCTDNSDSDLEFSLAPNGITITCPGVAPGESAKVNGVRYEAVDNDLLRARIGEGADLSKLCTSSVTNMESLFQDASTFNQDIGSWDTGNVTTMRELFSGASNFNQDISEWDIGSVTTLLRTFFNAHSFNQDIGGWNTGEVIRMNQMFLDARTFNKPIGRWNTSNVLGMESMFLDAVAFNQDLSGWCVEIIAGKPDFFDLRASSWTLPRPNWGASCELE